MFKFLVAKLGYQVQISGSPSTFLVACGYRATTKSYTVYGLYVFVCVLKIAEYLDVRSKAMVRSSKVILTRIRSLTTLVLDPLRLLKSTGKVNPRKKVVTQQYQCTSKSRL